MRVQWTGLIVSSVPRTLRACFFRPRLGSMGAAYFVLQIDKASGCTQSSSSRVRGRADPTGGPPLGEAPPAAPLETAAVAPMGASPALSASMSSAFVATPRRRGPAAAATAAAAGGSGAPGGSRAFLPTADRIKWCRPHLQSCCSQCPLGRTPSKLS